MGNLFFVPLISFLITFLSIPIVIAFSNEFQLFDIPVGRKLHATPIPTLGGISIFVSVFLTIIFSNSVFWHPGILIIFSCAIIIFLIGLLDDIKGLSPLTKFLTEFIVIYIIVEYGGMRIKSLHGLFGIFEIAENIQILITLLFILALINAFNLIDGIDGLAATLGTWGALFFGFIFSYCGEISYAIMAFSLGGSLIGFLSFNSSPAKIFMGDSGSLFIGIMNSIFAIRFINFQNPLLLNLNIIETSIVAVSIFYIPLFDAVRVFVLRALKGRSPFSADTNHIHHIF